MTRIALLGGSLLAVVLASCTASNDPDVGSLKVSVTTTGTNPDPDGYLVAIGQEPGEPIPAVGDITVDALPPGDYPARLSGLAANCYVTGANPLTVKVTAGAQATAEFYVSCPRPGTLVKVTTITTGTDLDPNGYLITFGADAVRRVVAQGVTNLSIGSDGPMAISLGDIAVNCTPDPTNPATITATLDAETPLTLKVTCAPLPRVVVNVVSTGQEIDADGYTVELHPSDDYYGTLYSFPVPSNGTATSRVIQPDTYGVVVAGAASNCHLTGPIPGPVVISTVAVALNLTVQCDLAKELAFVSGKGNGTEIAIGNERGTFTLLTSNVVADSNPAWSPDGTRLAFTSVRDGNNEIYLMNADGSDVRRLTNGVYADYQPSWSSDGTRIAFVSERDGNPEIYVMGTDGSNVLRLTNSSSVDAEPAWSPNGGQIVFVSDRSLSLPLVHLMNADGSGVHRLTSMTLAVASPAWSRFGAQIVFWQVRPDDIDLLQVVNADGSQATERSVPAMGPTSISWGPDDRIAFTTVRCSSSCNGFGITVLKLDGSLFDLPWSTASEAAWRP